PPHDRHAVPAGAERAEQPQRAAGGAAAARNRQTDRMAFPAISHPPDVRCAMELLTRIRSCAAVALGAASALAVLGGCDMLYDYRPLGAVEELVAVHAILVEGHDTAAVLVTRVDADGSSWPPVSPLAGATV